MSEHHHGIYNTTALETLRKKLRKSSTVAEATLWTHLKKRQLAGNKFRRQVSIGRYIADFYCPECRLVVELDGAAHFSATIDEYEDERTKYLEGLGIRVIRFENREVFENIEGVLATIKETLQPA